MELTPEENLWLLKMGGRDESDVLCDPDGKKYVYMFYPPNREKKVYINEKD